MNYPLLSDYIAAISMAEENFATLTSLRPVLGNDGRPFMSSGNFAVVFKMRDIETEKLYAVKCFTREEERREESYKQIEEQLKRVSSPYLVPIRYLEKELLALHMEKPITGTTILPSAALRSGCP